MFDFAFEPNPGELISRHERTRWSFFAFVCLYLLPFGFCAVAACLAVPEAFFREEWDMNPLAWFIFTTSSGVLLLYFLLRRLLGVHAVEVYENGLRLTSLTEDAWIPWTEISHLYHEFEELTIKFLFFKQNVLQITYSGKRIDIESGTGFTFENGFELFAEIVRRAPHAELKEHQDSLTM